MTAQRTTLISLCLVLITLANQGAHMKFLTLPATSLTVSLEYAVNLLSLVILLNGISYALKYVAEYTPYLHDNVHQYMEALNVAAEEVRETFKTATRSYNFNKAGLSPKIQNQITAFLNNAAAHQKSMEKMANHATHAFEEIKLRVARKRKIGLIRDWFFDFAFPITLALGTLLYSHLPRILAMW